MSSDCLFCRIASGEIPGDIVYEDDELLAFNDISPQAPHHVLVIPKVHIATVNELGAEHADLVGRLVLCAKAIAAERNIQEAGYRLILNCNGHGGQTVFHLHLHLLGGRQLMALG